MYVTANTPGLATHVHTYTNTISWFQVARSIKLVQEESPYFTIIPPKLGGSKVAPGMVAAYTIRFTPDEEKVAILKVK